MATEQTGIHTFAELEAAIGNAKTNADVKTAYEANSDTNAFTDAEQTKLSGISTGAEVNAVDSVNTQTGAVVLDADDIDDSATTNKFVTAADVTVLGNTSGTNTGDQDISGIATNASDISTIETSLATVTDFISGLIPTPADQDYTLIVKLPYAATITETTTVSDSGTCTATFKINTTALGGTANSVSSTEQSQAHASANSVSVGDDIVLTVSANSSCVDMSFTIKYTRAI